MGIHSAIRASMGYDAVNDTKFPGLARLGGCTKPVFEHHSGSYASGAGLFPVVYILDLIQHMYTLGYGGKNSKTFNGDALYGHLIRHLQSVKGRAHSGGFVATTVVLVCDAQDKMTPLKARTQASRSQRNKVVKYAIGSVLGDDGICEHTGGKFEPVCMVRLLGSRHLHLEMWRYLDTRLRADWRVLYALGFAVIWDYGAADGPVQVMCDNEDGTVVVDALRGCVHPFGEADLGTLYWCRVFHDKTIVLSTIDTDVLPLSAWYLSQFPLNQQQQLWWSYSQVKGGAAKTARLVDLTTLVGHIVSSFGSASLFMASCIACGTDFVQKAWVTNGVGTTTVLEGVISASSSLRDKFQSTLQSSPLSRSHASRCIALIRQAASCKTRASKHKTPKAAEVGDIPTLFAANMDYWRVNWLAFQPTDFGATRRKRSSVGKKKRSSPTCLFFGGKKDIGSNKRVRLSFAAL
jgi:hypothetical protein